MVTSEFVDGLEVALVYGSPLIGGGIACFMGIRAESAPKALGKTFAWSLLLGFAISAVFGLIIDAWLAGQQWQRWDGLWMPLVQLPVSAFSGLIYGGIALKIVEKRQESTKASEPMQGDAS